VHLLLSYTRIYESLNRINVTKVNAIGILEGDVDRSTEKYIWPYPKLRSGNSITPPGGLPLDVADDYTCGYSNRSLRVVARSLKVDNSLCPTGPEGPFWGIKRTDVLVSILYMGRRRVGPSTAAKIIAPKL